MLGGPEDRPRSVAPRITLRDLRELRDLHVPRIVRRGFGGRSRYWPAHEIGHLLTTEAWRHLRPAFALAPPDADDRLEHELRCRELAAMSVSRRLLCAAGRPDLARDERDDTDSTTVTWDDRGRVERILRRFRVLRLPRDRAGLEARLVRISAGRDRRV